jgi:prepilin-type N-terminal cleavage/methylation domain-containing protein
MKTGSPSRRLPPASARLSGGFTLLELLIVIALIAVLAAILVPVAGRLRNSALTAASTNNLRQIHTLFTTYLGENNNVFPTALGSTAENPAARYHWRRTIWEKTYGPFEGDVADKMAHSDYAKIMWCPLMVKKYGQEQHPWGRGSYAINFFFIDPTWRAGDPIRVLNREDLKGRVEPLIMTGTVLKSSPKFGTWEAVQSGRFPYDTDWMNLNYEYGSGQNSALGLFLDGHVETISKQRGAELDPLLRDATNFE